MHPAQVIYSKILSAQRILIITHYNPDGDALSSLSVFSAILHLLAKDFQAYCRTPLNSSHQYLPHLQSVASAMTASDFANFDVIISLDCGSVARTGIAELIMARSANQFFIEIDHHPQMENLSDLAYRPTGVSATTELLFNFCQINHIAISELMAKGILTGLTSDTGGFIYPSTTHDTMLAATQMLWRGARLPSVISQVLYSQSLTALRLWGLALSRLTINTTHQIAYTVLTYQDFADYQGTEAMTDDLAGWLVCLADVRAVLFLKQSQPGLIKGSWRTAHDGVDVSLLAQLMGGGGHAKAAGFACSGNLSQETGCWQIN
jgi:phosphoesterase RecJ-like protein